MDEVAWATEKAIELAELLEGQGNLVGAIETMEQAVALDAGNPKAHARLGRLYRLRKRWRDAIGEFDAALAIKPDAPSTFHFRGRAKSMLDDFDYHLIYLFIFQSDMFVAPDTQALC